ncbi:MAG: hypothetical protein ACLFP1_05010 [Candidatus Goldiibacteriota bacterium]
MTEKSRTAAVFGALFFMQAVLFFFIERKFVNGMLTGYTLGIINYFIIVFTVKKLILGSSEGMKTGARVLAGIVYIIKIIVFVLMLYMLIKFKEYYSLSGFLTGFTVSLAGIIIECTVINKIKTIRS